MGHRRESPSAKSLTEREALPAVARDFPTVGLALVFLGFAAAASALLASGRTAGADVKATGVRMVGPIPVIFGSDAKWASVAMALAIVLLLFAMLIYML